MAEAIVSLVRSGGTWRMLPRHFPRLSDRLLAVHSLEGATARSAACTTACAVLPDRPCNRALGGGATLRVAVSTSRRLARDYERLPETAEAMIYTAISRIMLRRVAR